MINLNRLETHFLSTKIASPQIAIIICTYQRSERLFICLNCLINSISTSKDTAEVIIMDNAIEPKLLLSLNKYLYGLKKLINFKYLHCPHVNQSVLRNKAMSLISASVKYFISLDSDIYLAKNTLLRCLNYLKIHQSVMAVSVPLVSYKGGLHNEVRGNARNQIFVGGDLIQMPNANDFLRNRIEDEILKTHMLRGFFVVRMFDLKQIFGNKPWIPAFEVWQNVPFFLTLQELGKKFGYILDPAIIALHDERLHSDTIRNKMKNWSAQTIKSIILIFYRNSLWFTYQKKLNKRFLEAIQPTLVFHIGDPFKKNLGYLFEIAQCITLNEEKGISKVQEIETKIPNVVIKESIKLLLLESWKDLQMIRSSDLDKQM